jgi:uncharacterized protein YqgC (DUF456 family)
MKKKEKDYSKYLKAADASVTMESPNSFMASLQQMKEGNYGQNLVSKSKYTIRGSLIGLALGAAVSMYYKKSMFFGAVIGAISGTAIGHVIGEKIINSKNKKNEIAESTV